MSACSQCGTVAKDTDKFCNVCGTPLARPQSGANVAAAGGPAPQYAPTPPPGPAVGPYAQTQAPPPQSPPYGAAPVARCQMGHEIAPGASYCAQGHPIALDQMQFANDPSYGGGAPQQAYAPQPQQGTPAASPYGAPQGVPGGPPYGAPQPAPGVQSAAAYGGGAQRAPGGYAPPPQAGYGAPVPQPGYAPQGPPQAQGYAPPPSPYGAPPPGQPAYAPTPQPGYPQPGPPGYGMQPPAPAPYAPEPPRETAPAKILRGFLVAYGANPSGDFWPLTGGRLVVGRLGAAEGIDISMQDPTISSRHAAMVVDATSGSVTVEDTGSTNGTFVNDEHIGFNGRRDVRDGDRLRFGGFTTIVKVIGRV
jgi:hypothetical protein